MIYSRDARKRLRRVIDAFRPDVAHVRGIYHHLSPSILWELKRQGIPVLYHLNDFKILCPTYNFVAHGRACELCSHGAFHNAATKGCYAGPRSSAVVLAAEAYLHKWLGTYERCVDMFLAPSEFVRTKLIASGFPAERIEVLPHFQALPGAEQLASDEGYLLYFGRLSPEKGVYELLRAMVRLPHTPLVIAGDGPERPRLEALAKELNLHQVLFAGTVHGEELQKLIAGCSFSVFPSHAYETLGKSILESYAWGKPVIASDLGSRRELVQHGVTGLLYADGDREQLAHSIGFLFDRRDLVEKMGAAARSRVKANHDPAQHTAKLLELYYRLTSTKKLLSFPLRNGRRHPPLHRSTPRRSCGVHRGTGRGIQVQRDRVLYEHAGRELARLGHEVTVYCRSYFTPPVPRTTACGCGGFRPSARSIWKPRPHSVEHGARHDQIATSSTTIVSDRHCSLFFPGCRQETVVTVQGSTGSEKWGSFASACSAWVQGPPFAAQCDHGRFSHFAATLSGPLWRIHRLRAQRYVVEKKGDRRPPPHLGIDAGRLYPLSRPIFTGKELRLADSGIREARHTGKTRARRWLESFG